MFTMTFIHLLKNIILSFVETINISAKAFNKLLRVVFPFKGQDLRLAARDMKRGIDYVPCQWCTDRRLLQEVMAYCLNFLVLQSTMTQKSAVCTTCHFNRVIRSYKSVGQFVIYVTTAVNTSIFGRSEERRVGKEGRYR